MLRPWKFELSIERQSGTPIHLQIAHKIAEDIRSGRFKPGMALPGTRTLSQQLRINRKTAVQAYDELIAQGWLVAQHKRGTFIAPHAPAQATSMQANHSGATTDHIDFSPIGLDHRIAPVQAINRALRHALINQHRSGTHTSIDPRGHDLLRATLAQSLNLEHGLNTSIENICIAPNKQIICVALARQLINSGDAAVICEHSYRYPFLNQTLHDIGAEILSLPRYGQGDLDLIKLEALCLRKKIRCVFVTPEHQTPHIQKLSLEQRLKLLRLAMQYDFYIIESHQHHHAAYTQTATSSIASLDKASRAIYIGNISESLYHDMEIAYASTTPSHAMQCANFISSISRTDSLWQRALTELLLKGEIKRHHHKLISIAQFRRAHICESINRELHEFCRIVPCESLHSIWLEVSRHINVNQLLADAQNDGLIVATPLDSTTHSSPIIQIGFAHLQTEEIDAGLIKLKKALSKQSTHLLTA